MPALTSCVVCYSTLLATISTAGVDAGALRKALPLPRITLGISLQFTPSDIGLSRAAHGDPLPVLAARAKRRPNDAEAHLALARAYEDATQSDRATRAAQVALRLLKTDSARRPNDPHLRARLGEALWRSGDASAGLKLLREATDRLPGDRAAWSARASAAQVRSMEVLYPTVGGAPQSAASRLSGVFLQMAKGKPTPEGIAASEALLREAAASLDMVVKCAPNDPNAYRERAAANIVEAFWIAIIKRGNGEQPGSGMFTNLAPARDDLWQVARLTRSDSAAWVTPVMMEMAVAAGNNPDEASGSEPDALWQQLPEDAKARCRTALDALKRLSGVPDRQKAAQAADALGKTLFLTGDQKAAESAFRRSIELAPEGSGGWDPLIGVLSKAGRWKEMVPIARRYAQLHDSPKARLILAKALDKSGDRPAAVSEILAARKRYPQSLDISLAAIVVDLWRPENPSALADLGTRLALLEAKIGKSTSEDLKQSLAITRAVHLGLQGKDGEAKRIIDELLEKEPGEATLTAVSDAMGG